VRELEEVGKFKYTDYIFNRSGRNTRRLKQLISCVCEMSKFLPLRLWKSVPVPRSPDSAKTIARRWSSTSSFVRDRNSTSRYWRCAYHETWMHGLVFISVAWTITTLHCGVYFREFSHFFPVSFLSVANLNNVARVIKHSPRFISRNLHLVVMDLIN
jgi:hypothetical protein